jgi:predicted O-methyltransferase YrrM
MTLRAYAKSTLERLTSFVVEHHVQASRRHSDVDVFLTTCLAGAPYLAGLNDPTAYIAFLRSCLEPATYTVQIVKDARQGQREVATKKFATLLDKLRQGAPPIPFPIAHKIGLIADNYRGNRQPFEFERWAGDLALFFEVSASLGYKGRLLGSITRFMRPTLCLELGTAFGMSSLFVLSTLQTNGQDGHLVTIEGYEPVFSLAAPVLNDAFGKMVSCHRGWIQELLPSVLKSLDHIDFFFHDADHSGEAYLSAFTLVEPHLAPGAAVCFDDIRWEDSRVLDGPSRTYDGWREIVRHDRVQQAVEIDGNLGLLLLR